ncbi:mannosyl (alpha-1,3-)-glycoprotein beta-1,2-N-acetylglucosaminyltransferase, partial [Cichlidogyrus casuarinus]
RSLEIKLDTEISSLRKLYESKLSTNQLKSDLITLPVVIFACNRPTVSKAITSVLHAKSKLSVDQFYVPIFVSQDGTDAPTKAAIESFNENVTLIFHQPKSSRPIDSKLSEGYFYLSQHYKDTIDKLFIERNYTSLIILEDDLEVSPDFFHYFSTTLPILKKDSSIYCVSAWNDNGKDGLIDKYQPELLYRSDFFPGLGWMLLRSLWLEIREGWPAGFWDEYMREPGVRKTRACIRPELGRTTTFGLKGVSGGQFFNDHLRYIVKYDKEETVNFDRAENFNLLGDKESYDKWWTNKVYSAELLQVDLRIPETRPKTIYRVEYKNKKHFERLAKKFSIMSDSKRGVPRTAYLGILSFMHRGSRIFLAPERPWTGYIDK